jgi:hypothetical protein|tara:strand:+ start:6703 stop:6972 length:270 start_codon:yes stop_codon:yes gene_type:complete
LFLDIFYLILKNYSFFSEVASFLSSGFDHEQSVNTRDPSVLYKYSPETKKLCPKKIGDELVSCVKHIYSNGDIRWSCDQDNVFFLESSY